MHKPTEAEKKTYAKHVAKELGITSRQVRKMWKSGKLKRREIAT